ncbi:aspartic peptidase domain-containing protein [Bombardia bombarda]|uniref:Aspartic peptidase domain-containing protein n=1 Tax=Bombardia bombarda TaxID=252184 RepID=A0AA39XJ62_9PEZI|nr:aspartic peptidase domain-containing protein [Bombardia bombarda]
MVGAALLLQLTLWIVTVHAFYPWPERVCHSSQCSGSKSERDINGDSRQTERTTSTTEGISVELVQRARNPNNDPSVTVARDTNRDAAIRFAHIHSPLEGSRPRDEDTKLTRRENTYSVVAPVTPTATKSAGIFQDGADYSYFLQVKYGTDEETLYMLLDTGAGNTWVMGPTCKSKACEMHNSFGPGDSTTLKQTETDFSIIYGTGNVAGVLANDTVSIAGLKTVMSFGIANETTSDFEHFPFDGILGLGMSKGATDNFLELAKKEGILTSSIFSVSLGRASDWINTGQITFGGVDTAKYVGDITYSSIPKEANDDWAVPMGEPSYDGKKAGLPSLLGYIDTGSSFVFGPSSNVTAFHKLITGAVSKDNNTSFEVPCDTKTPVTFSFGGVTYSVPSQDWVAEVGENRCESNIIGHEAMEGAWLLGDVFLKNVYTVFDGDHISDRCPYGTSGGGRR